MQIKFFGGSFHEQILKVPGELRDLPCQLRNPLNDTNEIYVRHEMRKPGKSEVVYVLKGAPPPDDSLMSGVGLCGTSPVPQMS